MTTMMPLDILTKRGNRTIPQAVALWLCDNPRGPRLSLSEAGLVMGYGEDGKNNVNQLLRNARSVKA